jgi:hypothetical protein
MIHLLEERFRSSLSPLVSTRVLDFREARVAFTVVHRCNTSVLTDRQLLNWDACLDFARHTETYRDTGRQTDSGDRQTETVRQTPSDDEDELAKSLKVAALLCEDYLYRRVKTEDKFRGLYEIDSYVTLRGHAALLPELIFRGHFETVPVREESQIDDHRIMQFMDFSICCSMIERVLYDLHAQGVARSASNPSSSTFITPKSSRIPRLILRDLLRSTEIEKLLGVSAVRVLKGLFSPSCLNLRNIV